MRHFEQMLDKCFDTARGNFHNFTVDWNFYFAKVVSQRSYYKWLAAVAAAAAHESSKRELRL